MIDSAHPVPTPEQVGANYDRFGELYGWTIGDFGIHAGMWVDPSEKHPVTGLGDLANLAQRRMTEFHIETLGLEPEQYLLDIGCGTGGPAVLVAERSGGVVTGITVSRSQTLAATARAEAAGLSDRVGFDYGDVNALEFADESFDAAMAIDVFAHLADQERAFAEVLRVLRPGGRFMLSQFTIREDPPTEQVAAFTQLWCTPPPLPLARALTLPVDVGFDLLRVVDLTQNCLVTSEIMVMQFADNRARILARYGADMVAEMDRSIPLFRDFCRDHLNYHLFLLRKPWR
ncbi:class I SAM-dependent methyltransferase [Nocardia panacis]|uniref:Class I SAM-dependent methyltransferase n=1 Tax=Nocardia panacis TaxID=2340916 RepID=A0A3A4K845_9NOCA|nr:methyltransferase domain-containing protein [Nocardia panacis]RJO73722.1 class I SAM-dependent methyltransferase [Nocardia panacis]